MGLGPYGDGIRLNPTDRFVIQEDSPDRPSGGDTPGMAALKAVIAARFRVTVSSYVNRANTGAAGGLSEHAVGRGADIMITGATGRRLKDFLYRNAGNLGLQSIIFEGRVWGYGNYVWRRYTGNEHSDHIHIGLTVEASQALTRQYVETIFASYN